MFLETFIPYLAAAVPAFLLGLYIGRNSNTKVGTPSASHNSAMDAIATQVQTIARNADISPYDRLDKIVTLVMSQRHQ